MFVASNGRRQTSMSRNNLAWHSQTKLKHYSPHVQIVFYCHHKSGESLFWSLNLKINWGKKKKKETGNGDLHLLMKIVRYDQKLQKLLNSGEIVFSTALSKIENELWTSTISLLINHPKSILWIYNSTPAGLMAVKGLYFAYLQTTETVVSLNTQQLQWILKFSKPSVKTSLKFL